LRLIHLAILATLLLAILPAAHASIEITCMGRPIHGIATVVNTSSGLIIGGYNASDIPFNASSSLAAVVSINGTVYVVNLSSSNIDICRAEPISLDRVAVEPIEVPGSLHINASVVSVSLPARIALINTSASLCLPVSLFVGSSLYILKNLTMDGSRVGWNCVSLPPGNHSISALYAAQISLASPYVAVPSAVLGISIVIAAVYGIVSRRSSVARY